MVDSMDSARRAEVFIVSGGTGAAGRLVLDTLLAQFPGHGAHVTTWTLVRSAEQVRDVLLAAAQKDALVLHGLVDANLRGLLVQQATELGVEIYDLFGDLLARLRRRLGQVPMAEPGRYRLLRQDYYERIEAIEFSIDHDDSQNLATIRDAEIVLVGVSRSGKTPLSMYLAMHGWKVANVSFIPGVPWPSELDSVDKSRVLGLLIDREQLLAHRRRRSAEVGLTGMTSYSSEESLFAELEALRAALAAHRLGYIDVTEKPIESTAQEVIQRITRALGDSARRR